MPTEPLAVPRPTSSVAYRLLHDKADLDEALGVVLAVWGTPAASLVSLELLRAFSHSGNPVIGATTEDGVCGVSIGFVAIEEGLHLHSHITGVLPSHQHLGIGFGLKVAQRAWCLDHDIDRVTWTVDPLLARNAYFNLHKLGATSRLLLPDFYGAMADEVNAGDISDRLEVRWPIASARVDAALAAASRHGRADTIDGSKIVERISIPRDYHELRRQDPPAAASLRRQVRAELLDAFARGLEAVDFTPTGDYCLAPADQSGL